MENATNKPTKVAAAGFLVLRRHKTTHKSNELLPNGGLEKCNSEPNVFNHGVNPKVKLLFRQGNSADNSDSKRNSRSEENLLAADDGDKKLGSSQMQLNQWFKKKSCSCDNELNKVCCNIKLPSAKQNL